MNEPKLQLAISPTQEAVLFAENMAKSADSSDEFCATVAVMVNVHFDVGDSRARHLRQGS
jgi:hypothetical protein